jgi:hypothetical protein
VKVVFHLNSGALDKKSELLGNVANLREENPDAEISVVVNSDGVEIARKGSSAADYIEGMDNVNFKACKNSLENRDISVDELVESFSTVPAAVLEIAELQEEGYNYIKI